MNIVDSLQLYFSSQKALAMGILWAGGIMLLIALCLHLQSLFTGPLWQGARTGMVVGGLAFLLIGSSYLSFCTRTEAGLTALHELDSAAFIVEEKARIERVATLTPVYQKLFAALVLAALLLMLYGREYWVGIGFATALFFVTFMLIEAHSLVSVTRHHEFMQQQVTG